jgi:hypothetical protein
MVASCSFAHRGKRSRHFSFCGSCWSTPAKTWGRMDDVSEERVRGPPSEDRDLGCGNVVDE